jgi:hypothetical protein
LLSGIGHVENAATMDESIWSWHCTEKTFGGNEGNQIPRCHPADKRKKDQAPRVSYCAERTENTAPEYQRKNSESEKAGCTA